MIHRILLVLLAFAAAVGAPGELRAQCSADSREQFTVDVTPSPIGFAQPTAANFNAGSPGYIDGPAVTLTFTSTKLTSQWKICLRYASTATSLGNGKALSDLLWSADGTTWNAVTSTNQLVFIGEGRATYTRTLYLRSLLRWTTDTPFTYGAPLEITGSY